MVVGIAVKESGESCDSLGPWRHFSTRPTLLSVCLSVCLSVRQVTLNDLEVAA